MSIQKQFSLSHLLLCHWLPNGGETEFHDFADLGEIRCTLIPNATNSSLELINCCKRTTIATIIYFLLNVIPKVVI